MSNAPKVLAIASMGGHFVQLCRTLPAWQDCDVAIVTTDPGFRNEALAAAELAGIVNARFHSVTDANRWRKIKLLQSLLDVTLVLLRERPDVVITTGAAPGYFALRIGRLLGARTIWLDSIANASELSLAGRKAGPHADLWLTQWEDLSRAEGPHYHGSVI
jgi:UDP-N-acetylglucosamine:LPS N-acetylglucosamine transferase